MNKGFLADAIADEAHECRVAARDAIDEFSLMLEAAQDEGEQEEVKRLNNEIETAVRFIAEMGARIDSEAETAFNIWVSLLEIYDDTMARGRLARRQAVSLRQQERYLEAIAELDLIRWEDLQFFDEASDLIIEIKQEAEIPLSISEGLKVLRLEDEKRYINEDDLPVRIRRIECEYMKDAA